MLTRMQTGADVLVEIGGAKLGSAGSYLTRAEREVQPVWEFGETQPAGMRCGRTVHRIELRRLRLAPGTLTQGSELYALADFTLSVVRGGQRITYAHCEWELIEESADAQDEILERAVFYACTRTQSAA